MGENLTYETLLYISLPVKSNAEPSRSYNLLKIGNICSFLTLKTIENKGMRQ